MQRRTAVVGVDIGGTKSRAGVVDVQTLDIVISAAIATPRLPPDLFYDAIADLVRQVRAQAERASHTVLPLVAVAHPGRFLPDGSVARGTTPNLGTAPGQFDGSRPAQELARRLSSRVHAENDAVAQMRFGLDLLLRDPATRPHLLGETVVYLGPGTGMGGGVARVSSEGVVTTVTDGHFFDLLIPGNDEDPLTAEELFTGPAIARDIAARNARLSHPITPATAEQLDRLLSAVGSPEPPIEAQRIADAFGEIFARLIATVHAGAIRKVRVDISPAGRMGRYVDEPDRAWSDEDRAAVRGVRRVLFGGSVGCSAGLGGRIRERAVAVLRQQGLGEIMVFPVPAVSADAGLLGVVLGLPKAD